MNRLKMGDELLDEIYKVKNFQSSKLEHTFSLGNVTEKDKFKAAKQILLGLAILYVMTIVAYLIRPHEGSKLLDICTITFPQLVTIILVAYFRDKVNT